MKKLSIYIVVLFLGMSLQSCFEVDEPVDVIIPSASIVFNDNSLSDGATFPLSAGVVNFKVTVTASFGTVTDVSFANRYTVTGGAAGTRIQPISTIAPNANGVIEFSVPIAQMRLESDPLITFANRGNNAIRVTANTSAGPTTRFFFVNFTNN
jgi:hypothetical protein